MTIPFSSFTIQVKTDVLGVRHLSVNEWRDPKGVALNPWARRFLTKTLPQDATTEDIHREIGNLTTELLNTINWMEEKRL